MSEDYNKHSHECIYEHHTQFVVIRVSKVLKTEAKLNIKKKWQIWLWTHQSKYKYFPSFFVKVRTRVLPLPTADSPPAMTELLWFFLSHWSRCCELLCCGKPGRWTTSSPVNEAALPRRQQPILAGRGWRCSRWRKETHTCDISHCVHAARRLPPSLHWGRPLTSFRLN